MHIVVCAKQILDPEIPPAYFEIDPERKQAVRGNSPLVMSTFDECAVEVALQVKDAHPDTVVSVVTVGPDSAKDVLRYALSMKCDKAVHVKTVEDFHPDSIHVARLIYVALGQMEKPDLVLFGRESGDWGCGQVGAMVAELLDLPMVNNACQVEQSGGTWRIRSIEAAAEVVYEAADSLVVTITNASLNVPRFPAVRDKMLSARKPVQELAANMFGEADVRLIQASDLPVLVTAMYTPQVSEGCYLAEGATVEDQVADLVKHIRDMNVL